MMASPRNPKSAHRSPLPNPSSEQLHTALKSEHYGVCRICLEEANKNYLISPCRCRGSHAYVHKSCLRRWFESSGKPYCDICKTEYVMRSVGLKPFTDWDWPQPLGDDWEDKVDYWACILWMLFSSRIFYAFFKYGFKAQLGIITDALGRGFIRSIWLASFVFNCIYYVQLAWRIGNNWWERHQLYEWDFMKL